jgi:hypothetical protein
MTNFSVLHSSSKVQVDIVRSIKCGCEDAKTYFIEFVSLFMDWFVSSVSGYMSWLVGGEENVIGTN